MHGAVVYCGTDCQYAADEDNMLAKTVWQFLIESMNIFRHTIYELKECSVQIIVSMNIIFGKILLKSHYIVSMFM